MTDDQNTTKQDLKNQIQALMAQVEKENQENAVVNKQMISEVKELKQKIDVIGADIEKDLNELDKIEKETGDKLDKIILEQAEDAGDDL